MSANEHYEAAAHLLAFENEPNGASYIDPNTHNLLNAQAAATLALAYEQRTANLIAFEKNQWESWKNGELNKEGHEIWTKAANQITERLGLA